MLFSAVFGAALLATGANAHFRLNYPPPRGPFVSDKEPEFCGGYTDVTTNRTTFPLSGGHFRIRQGHENWTASVLISTAPNPNSFNSFESSPGQFQFARLWANEPKGGNFCIPLDLSNTGIDGVVDGANVTIQVTLAGADGDLYQCADLTLSSNFTLPDEESTCVNSTNPDGHGHGGGSSGNGTAAPGDGDDDDEDDAATRGSAAVFAVGLAGIGSLLAIAL